MAKNIDDATNTSSSIIPNQWFTFFYKPVYIKSLKSKILGALTLIFLVINIRCSEEPAGIEDNLPSGRRDYEWTVDTLKTTDFLGIHQVWGLSPNSTWAIGIGTSARDCLWYYDGIEWKPSQQILNSNLTSIFGCTPDELWIGDANSTIWKYENGYWRKFKELSLEGFSRIVIASIWGSSRDELYAVGFADGNANLDYKGIILKYDGTDWNFVNIPDMRIGFERIKIHSNGEYLITGATENNGFLYKVFVFKPSDGFTEIYSGFDYPGLDLIGSGLFVNINKKIYKYKDQALQVWKDFSDKGYYSSSLGRTEKDFFCACYDGIAHFNGSDLAVLYSSNLKLFGVLIFENEVFFTAWNQETLENIMIKGTLKIE